MHAVRMKRDYLCLHSRFIANLLAEGGKDVGDHDSFVISFGDFVAKPFSLEYLTESEEPVKL